MKSRHEGGLVVLRYAPRAADRGWREIVHGGIATTLLDEVMTWSAILHTRRACVAAELSVRLSHPITVGQPLRIVGEILLGNARLMQARGRIYDAQDQILCESTGKFVPMDAAVASACAEDFVTNAEAIPVQAIFEAGTAGNTANARE